MVAHSHVSAAGGGRGDGPPVTAAELYRHRRALRILVVVLIPLGVWTLVGLIALWPGDVSGHVRADAAGYSVPGVTYPRAEITAIAEIPCDGLAGSTPGANDTRCANVTARLLEGDDTGATTEVPLTSAVYSSGTKVGQTIVLIRVPPSDGAPAQYQFSDFERRVPLLVFALVFAVVVAAVARWRGFASLLGLAFAGFILVKFMFPALVAGGNPVLIGLIGSSAIMFVVLYAAHGFSARTTTALVGTLFGLILSAVLGYVATRWAHLTGVAAEDDYVLSAAAPDLRLTSVVVCGVIVAGLGVLNDVTITQASAVWELADGHDGRGQRHLFARAMRIGRDHIASTVYTIAFATAGASLSVLLLIAIYDRPLLQVLQTEQFAGEVIRTLVGSIGLVLAVPLTTAIGVAVVRASGRPAGRARTALAEDAGSETWGEHEADAETQVIPTGRSRRRRAAAASAGTTATASAAEPGAGPATPDSAGLATPDGAGPGAPAEPPREAADDAPVGDPVADVISDAAERPARRRWRRHEDDDFGFSDLRDPDDTTPGRRRP